MITISVKVIPHAKRNLIKKEGDFFKIYLNAPAIEGKANQALIRFLAQHYRVAKSAVVITKGLKSRFKTVMIKK